MDVKIKSERPYIRLFTKKRIEYFLKNAVNDPPLLQTNPDGSLQYQDIHSAFTDFLKQYKKMLDKYFPLVRLSRKKYKDKPWITNGIKVSIRHRNKLYKRYIENRTVTNEQN